MHTVHEFTHCHGKPFPTGMVAADPARLRYMWNLAAEFGSFTVSWYVR